MMDPRIVQLAQVLVGHSLKLQPGESVLVEVTDAPDDAVIGVVETICAAGAIPIVAQKTQPVQRVLLQHATEAQLKLTGEVERQRMEQVDAYLGIRAAHNISELSDVPPEHMKLYSKHVLKPVHFDLRVPRGRWVILRWPTPSMAQLAGLSTPAFTDFYFAVCTIDYEHLSRAMEPLRELLLETDRVRLVAPGTELGFSIKDIPAISCGGEYNIPDGEVFTAPVRDSINGTIAFNAPTIYEGVAFDQIRLTFKAGQVVDAVGSDTARLNEILETDAGARYTGEFAIGVNPLVTRPMRDILFDEKIAGSIHLTPGQAYEEADNGNRSQIHWDMVLLQDAASGGGELWFDDVLVRKDGLFVVDSLLGLNPDQLLQRS